MTIFKTQQEEADRLTILLSKLSRANLLDRVNIIVGKPKKTNTLYHDLGVGKNDLLVKFSDSTKKRYFILTQGTNTIGSIRVLNTGLSWLGTERKIIDMMNDNNNIQLTVFINRCKWFLIPSYRAVIKQFLKQKADLWLSILCGRV